MGHLESQHRRTLVRAAEGVVDACARALPRDVTSTQLSRLIGVCQQASCAEEVENYLRYQVGRRIWPATFTHSVIEAARKATVSIEDDELRVVAWRHYATYLKRAFVYRLATKS